MVSPLFLQAQGLHQQNRFADAEALYRQVTAAEPGNFAAWYNRGLALRQLGRGEEAVESFDHALALGPSLPALFARGDTLLDMGRYDEAAAAFDQLLKHDPSLHDVWNNKAMAEWRAKRLDAALASYDQAVALAPHIARFWIYRYSVLFAMKRHDAALASLDKALALEPGNDAALLARGELLCEAGRVEEGLAVFASRGARLYAGQDISQPGEMPHKQRHDEEQRAYLAGQGVAHGKYHLEPGARVPGHAVNPNASAQQDWRASHPQLIAIDDFLTAEALDGLRRYCWGSTVWQRPYEDGYLGAFPKSGFGCPLLAQVAEELPQRFPEIFAGHPLCHMWAFKYDSSLSGINVHADEAAVNVNFWITPDEANLDPAHGGLVVWDANAPLDWDAYRYNGDIAGTREYLAQAGSKSRTVPYRANRAVIFDSDLFHETDVLKFRPGYQNRRINITMLFGRRGAQG
jgi:tetratricopeptide (TPR) repeat protein